LFHNKLPFPTINEEFVEDIFRAIGTKDTRGRKVNESRIPQIEKLERFYKNEFQPIHGHQKHSLINLPHAYAYVSTSIVTSIKTNIKTHFCKHLAKLINIFADSHYRNRNDEVDKKELGSLIYKTKSAVLRNKFDEVPEVFESFAENVKSYLPSNIEESVYYDVKTRPLDYLPFFLKINQRFEKRNEYIESEIERLKIESEEKNKEKIKKLNENFIKLFQPLPLRLSNVPKYVKIDTASLIDFLEKEGKASKLRRIKKIQKGYWSKHFNLKHKVFKPSKGYKFDYSIVTDGVGCTVCFSNSSFKKKENEGEEGNKENKQEEKEIPYIEDLKEEEYESLKGKKIVAGDPGKRNMMYLLDSSGKKLAYTNTWRDVGSQGRKCRNAMNKMIQKENIKEKEQALSLYCSKTMDYKKFKEFIRVRHETSKKTEEFYQRKVMRKLRWRKCIGRKRTDDNFLNKMEEKFSEKGKEMAIVLGDWNNRNTIRGLESTMGKSLKKLIARRFQTYQINEYNTSKKCCNCWKDIEVVKIKGRNKHGGTIKGVDSGIRILGCRSCAGLSRKEDKKLERESRIERSENGYPSILPNFKLLTRDKNSCINMLKIVQHILYDESHSRPKEFTREEKKLYLLPAIKKEIVEKSR
jgi:hypothetical protein